MFGYFLLLGSLGRALRHGFKDAEIRAMFGLVAMLLVVGVLFYMHVEKWSFVNSLYFCVVTMATVGYGDITPQTELGKLFTIVYILLGVGILVGFINLLAKNVLQVKEKKNKR